MAVRLSDHFSLVRLVRFTLPAVGMLVITSLYTVADGFFVSNFVGKTAFVAINLIYPFILLPGTLGFMIGTGGSALVAKTLGEGKTALAAGRFSLLVYCAAAFGLLLSLIWLPLLRPAALALGAEGEVLEACVTYGRILIPGLPLMILQFMFQSFFSLAEHPRLGLLVTVAAGVTNIVLDALFILVFDWGLTGAALATTAGMAMGAVPPLIFFTRPDAGRLRLGRASLERYALFKSCTNGASEFMTNVALSVTAMLFNFQLLRLTGENGVAAYGVLMYIGFVFISVFCGYAFGVIPVIGYHYGAHNRAELKGLFRRSLALNAIFGVLLTAAALLSARPLACLFVGYDPVLLAMTEHACTLYAFSFLLAGFNIFASSLFTALNNGLVSAGISFARTLAFQAIAVFALPPLFGPDGIWSAAAVAEAAALGVTLFCFRRMRNTYGYM